jgi:hypothetical protein
MKFKLLLLVLVFTSCSVKLLNAQKVKTGIASDTLVKLGSGGNYSVAEKDCLISDHAAKKFNWFKMVILTVGDPSEKPCAENVVLKYKVASMQKDGVIVKTCIACSNMYGVTDELKVCEVDVKGLGVSLTRYLRRGYRILSC